MNRSLCLTIFAALIATGTSTAFSASNDFRDLAVISQAVNQALETQYTGAKVPWSNPVTGNGGTIEVTKTYFLGGDTPCREYTRTIGRPGARPLVVKGTGCRTPTGFWRLNEASASTATRWTEPKPPRSGPAKTPGGTATKGAAKRAASPPSGQQQTGGAQGGAKGPKRPPPAGPSSAAVAKAPSSGRQAASPSGQQSAKAAAKQAARTSGKRALPVISSTSLPTRSD